MNVKNCVKCRKLFNYVSGPSICPTCVAALEKKFVEVKTFVYKHRSATMQEIVEACDVEPRQVEQWIREERLTFSSESPIKMSCENCGAPILTGRFCEECKKTTMSGLNAAGKSLKDARVIGAAQETGIRMHTYKK